MTVFNKSVDFPSIKHLVLLQETIIDYGRDVHSGLPTFRNCLEGVKLSLKRKNPRVGSVSTYYLITGPLVGSRGKALDRGPRQCSLL